MKRSAIALAELAARDNLALATWKAARGKRHRPAVARFLADLDARLNALAGDILAEQAPAGHFRRFTIHDPKRRTITAVCFADRVLHHAILNLAETRFERMLVDSTYACRPGKGVHRAAAAVQSHMRRWPWLVRVDVDSYFPSIDHNLLKQLLAQRFKGAEFLALLDRIIDAGATDRPGCGLPIGALTSQHFANAYLDTADRFLLDHPNVHAQVRYMDDIVWWCASRQAAMDSLEDLRELLWDARRLRLKSSAHIGRSDAGLTFCGFRIRQGIVLASSRKLARFRDGIARIEWAALAERVTPAELQRAGDGLLATLAAAETVGFRRRLLHEGGDRPSPHDYADARGCRS